MSEHEPIVGDIEPIRERINNFNEGMQGVEDIAKDVGWRIGGFAAAFWATSPKRAWNQRHPNQAISDLNWAFRFWFVVFGILGLIIIAQIVDGYIRGW